MEEMLRRLVQARKDALVDWNKRAKELLSLCMEGTGALEEEFIRTRLQLKQVIEAYDREASRLVQYATEESSQQLLCEGLSEQMNAEGTLVEFETTNHFLKQASDKTDKIEENIRLPKLESIKFDGDYLKWTEFWDRFTSSIDSRKLKNVDKLTYLIGSLEGKALKTIEGLSITNDNYEIAVETLRSRFGSRDRVVDAHYQELHAMSKCSDKADEALNNLDKIERHLRILSSLGENIESNHLRAIILEKFPERILYEVNVRLSGPKTVSHIRETLRNIITAMELSQAASNSGTLHNIPTVSSTETLHVRAFKRGRLGNGESKQTPTRTNGSHGGKTSRKRKTEEDTPSRKPKLNKRSCIFCDGDHFNDECDKVKDIQARKTKLKGRCFNCFRMNHRYNECKKPKRCHYCTGPHNRALCYKKTGVTGTPVDRHPTLALSGQISHNCVSFLQTATARVHHNNKSIPCRILLDCGSQRSYITTTLAKQLALTPEREDLLLIFTFGSDKPTETRSPFTEVTILTNRGIQKKIQLNIVPHITDRIPVLSVNTELVDILAEDGSLGQGIDLLIGNDYYFSLIRTKKIKIDDNLYLVDTDFGWMASGCLQRYDNEKDEVLSVITYHQTDQGGIPYTQPDLPLRNLDIKFLWTLENIGITDAVKANREEEAVQHFNSTVEYQDGRYYVKWPWAQPYTTLPTNYGQAYGRLKGLLQRIDQPTLEEYNEILQEQLQANVIEIVKPESDLTFQREPPIHYLPHHIVKQSGKRGRIVYDASSKTKDQLSLNECLYRGPCMLQDLTALLINFRMHKIGILADVEKAFLQIGLQSDDRDVTRFLWLKDINKPLNNDNILHLRFCRVPFGIISSPFLLTATIRYHILKTNEDLVEHIANKCYVDNLVTGANSSEEAYQLFEETRRIFKQLSMNIRDWTTNDDILKEKIPEECRAKETEETKVLGLLWNKAEDTLQIKINDHIVNQDQEKLTKRQVLRTLASVYDPCGVVSPLLMPAKLFLQELWRKEYKWDTPLPSDLEQRWKDIVSTLCKVRDVKIHRYIGFIDEYQDKTEYELHCFTDASKYSYAAATYLRCKNGQRIKTILLMSKTRVAPLEKNKRSKNNESSTSEEQTKPAEDKGTLTIPQLELLGYVIGSRLLKYLKTTITVPITKQYLWTDSLIVLNWVQSNKLLPPFVTNRVNEIKKNGNVEMCYINTSQNPADVATRPELWEHKRNLWLQGPDFLLYEKEKWPKDMRLEHHHATFSLMAEGLENYSPDITVHSDIREQGNDEIESMEETSREVPVQETRYENMTNQGGEEYSEIQIIKELQSKYYQEEIKGKETHLTRNLGLFVDVDGLLRCKGRMTHTDWSYDMKHPVLLPKDCEFTTNVIRETHEKNYHVGVPHTLSIVRQRFWIPQGRTQVQKIIRRCPQCIKHGGGPYKLPATPALPPERLTLNTPNTYIGIDYFGPMLVKSGEKRWICLFTCLVVRAIHLEVVKDLTAEECLLALRRFVANRGLPSLILSDNASQFKLTSEILTSTYCIENKVRWRFTPQLAPWHGGVYERLVALVKNCLKRTLGKHLLDDSQLQTVIKEVESVVNTRPLTCVSADGDYVLKPADFLSMGRCLTMDLSDDQILPEGTAAKRGLIESWRRGQRIMNEFKEMFIGQYLTSLRERYRHGQKQPRVKSHRTPCVGDIVQIKGESKNRQTWRVGKIASLIKSKDGEYRVAKVKVGDTEFIRSVGHLYPLEAEEEEYATDKELIRGRNVDETQFTAKPIEQTVVEQEAPQQRIEEDMDVDATTVPDLMEPSTAKEHGLIEGGENTLAEETSRGIDIVDIPSLIEPEDSENHMENTQETNETELREQETKESAPGVDRVPRAAAVRAREKITEWTRQLFALLF